MTVWDQREFANAIVGAYGFHTALEFMQYMLASTASPEAQTTNAMTIAGMAAAAWVTHSAEAWVHSGAVRQITGTIARITWLMGVMEMVLELTRRYGRFALKDITTSARVNQ